MTANTMGGMPPPSGGYPVQVTFDESQQLNRLWGIPLLGWMARIILLIPHFVVLWFLQVGVALSVLVSWIPVLLTGRQADILVSFYVNTYRYTARVTGWAFFLAAPYPPIVPGDGEYPINLEYEGGDARTINRLWGIPFFGIWVRSLAVIPHAILLFILYFPLALVSLVIWIPILINGRMPSLGYTLYGGFIRLTTRVYMWVLLMPTPYPPLGIS